MSKEIKKTEKPELSEQELDKAAGGVRQKAFLAGHSFPKSALEPPPPPAKTPGTNSL